MTLLSFKRPNRVFVSHAAADRPLIQESIISLLERHGIRTWVAENDIGSAAEWHRQLVNGLSQSDWFLLAMTPRALNSEWVKAEVHWAMEEGRFDNFVPVLVQDCDWKSFHLQIRRLQYVDFRSEVEQAQNDLLGIWGIPFLSATTPEERLVGTRVEGRVTEIEPEGVIVHLRDGTSGFIDIGQMTWETPPRRPDEIVRIGDVLHPVVLAVDTRRNQLALGLKQTFSNPWFYSREKYPVGSSHCGRVSAVTDELVVVELEEGLQGQLPLGEIDWTGRLRNPGRWFSPGQEIVCVVLSVDPENRAMGLGYKQLHPNPWDLCAVGARSQGKVVKIGKAHTTIELDSGLLGTMPIAEMSWGWLTSPADRVRLHEIVRFEVLTAVPKEHRLLLGMKQLYPNPWEKYPLGSQIRLHLLQRMQGELPLAGLHLAWDHSLWKVESEPGLQMRAVLRGWTESQLQDVKEEGNAIVGWLYGIEFPLLTVSAYPDPRKETPDLRTREVLVRRTLGICARPSAKIVHLCTSFDCEVFVRKIEEGEVTFADCRNIVDLLLLAISQGTLLDFHATGPQAAEVLDALAELLNNPDF